jgi:tetratricopeptide (TPR) repeat protein
MTRHIATACIAVAPLLLGGCTFMHKLGFGHARSVQQASRVDETAPAVPADLFTARGRAQLDAGNIGLAVEAFQQAIGTGEARGPALNGLGVAYARLGRADVAAQLFRQAMAEDPANDKFAANLAMLEQSQKSLETPSGALTAERTDSAAPAPAPAAASAPAPALAASPAPAPAPRVAAAAAPQPEGRLVQVAPREFTIRTLRQQPALAATAASPRRYTVPAGFRPIVRITLRPPAPATPAPEAPLGKAASR